MKKAGMVGEDVLLSGASLVALAVNAVALYFIIRFAVKHGIQDSKKM